MADNDKDKHDRAKEIADAVDALDAKKDDKAKSDTLKKKADASDDGDDSATSFSKIAGILGKICDRLDGLESKSNADEGKKAKADEVDGIPGSKSKPQADEDEDDDGDDEKDPRKRSAKRDAKLANAQARADAVASAFGSRAEKPMYGEGLLAYRRRLAMKFRHNSPEFKEIDLYSIEGKVFDAVETRIYADSMTASATPIVPNGVLLERVTYDDAGRKITSFMGNPRDWMQHFAGSRMQVVKINTRSDY